MNPSINKPLTAATVEKFGEVYRNDWAGAEDLFAEDFVLHYFNAQLPDLAGDYRGVAGIKEFFGRLQQRTGKTFSFVPRSLAPFGDELAVSSATIKLAFGSTELEIDAVVVWRVVAGRIAEMWDIPAVNTPRVHTPANP